MKLTYTNVNGYLIPNLTYKSGEQMERLGKYGFLFVKRFTNSSQKISTHLLTVLIISVILQLEQRKGNKKRTKK